MTEVLASRRRAFARATVALVFTSLALTLALRDRAEADSAARLLPEGLHLPEAEALIPLEGELSWNGNSTETLVVYAEAEPPAFIAQLRSQWEDRPVEFYEAEVSEGRALTVIDFHEGLRWTFVARRIAEGRTEAIRALAPLVEEAPEPPLPFELPAGLELVSHLEDGGAGGRVVSVTAVEVEADARLGEALCAAAAASGWEGECEIPLGGEEIEFATLQRGSETLFLGLAEGPFEKRWVQLRWEKE